MVAPLLRQATVDAVGFRIHLKCLLYRFTDVQAHNGSAPSASGGHISAESMLGIAAVFVAAPGKPAGNKKVFSIPGLPVARLHPIQGSVAGECFPVQEIGEGGGITHSHREIWCGLQGVEEWVTTDLEPVSAILHEVADGLQGCLDASFGKDREPLSVRVDDSEAPAVAHRLHQLGHGVDLLHPEPSTAGGFQLPKALLPLVDGDCRPASTARGVRKHNQPDASLYAPFLQHSRYQRADYPFLCGFDAPAHTPQVTRTQPARAEVHAVRRIHQHHVQMFASGWAVHDGACAADVREHSFGKPAVCLRGGSYLDQWVVVCALHERTTEQADVPIWT